MVHLLIQCAYQICNINHLNGIMNDFAAFGMGPFVELEEKDVDTHTLVLLYKIL